MWVGKSHGENKTSARNGLVAIAVDKDKGSQCAIRWAGDNLLSRGQTVILIHVHNDSSRILKSSHIPSNVSNGVPDFCTVYVISKGKVSSVRKASRPVPHASPLLDQIQNLRENSHDSFHPPRLSTSPDSSSIHSKHKFANPNSLHGFSSASYDSGHTSNSSHHKVIFSQSQTYKYLPQYMDEVEAEMRRLKLELKQTMELYSTACKEALAAKQKEMEMHCWRLEEERRLEEARFAQEAALSIVEKERAKCKAAIDATDAAQKLAELEALRRANVEMKVLKSAEEMKKVLDSLNHSDARCRMYTIKEIEAATNSFDESYKIGEGGYGPVFKCYLDHTPVAVKVLRPDAAHGKSQFQQEVEVLSRIRHPNMVLLLGACPEHGCLVYEFMANGSLDDQVATGLMFLHQTKPEPLVHRDLKPGNILLGDNYVSKISDVGLARLVPPSVAENVTQYRMTSTAGTFCYIDPEYQQTGMLAVKSDVYSLGIVLLQLITGKPPMGVTHNGSTSIENGNFLDMLDPDVPNWPVEEAFCLAQLALQCAELRRKDRPDLGKVVFPELNRLRDFAEENIENGSLSAGSSIMKGPLMKQST
ncbi:hypothetical protein EUGRSUZ_F04037 [Eucalyptus grandis]|uniref:Uncharacterized protein n=2 Tax=Eucalyptus grandis TaxID=71139 RepID=A0ACC3KNH9_EUCGR|nr:hypothetical protein EUGRSUZ_F04037 [Eucalyptus grandis]